MFRLLYIYTLIKLLKVGFTARTSSLRQLGLTWNKIRSSNGIWTIDGCQRISKHPRLFANGSLFKRTNAGAGSEHVHKKGKSYKNLYQSCKILKHAGETRVHVSDFLQRIEIPFDQNKAVPDYHSCTLIWNQPKLPCRNKTRAQNGSNIQIVWNFLFRTKRAGLLHVHIGNISSSHKQRNFTLTSGVRSFCFPTQSFHGHLVEVVPLDLWKTTWNFRTCWKSGIHHVLPT
jgi:hypothetical protein